MPSAGMSGLSWNGRQVISAAISGRITSARSSRRLPMKHQGHTTSEMMSICMVGVYSTRLTRCSPMRNMARMADFTLDGRIALVTGASRGLGRHFAGVLARAGAAVALAARDQTQLAEVKGEVESAGGRAATV